MSAHACVCVVPAGPAAGPFPLHPPVLTCPPPKVTFLKDTCPRPTPPPPAVPSSSPVKSQNKPQRGRHAARSPHWGGKGDYRGLRPSLILHFSSPQHLPLLSVSCQNRKSFHPSVQNETPDVRISLSPAEHLKYFLTMPVWFDWFFSIIVFFLAVSLRTAAFTVFTHTGGEE